MASPYPGANGAVPKVLDRPAGRVVGWPVAEPGEGKTLPEPAASSMDACVDMRRSLKSAENLTLLRHVPVDRAWRLFNKHLGSGRLAQRVYDRNSDEPGAIGAPRDFAFQ